MEVSNSESLAISDIQGKNGKATEIKIFNHNLLNGEIVQIDSIPSPSPFSTSLNNKRFSVQVIDENTCSIFTYLTLLSL